jgi:general secretion pathway protein M
MPWRNRFQSLPDKDRQRIQFVLIALFGSLLWFWNIAPALKTYQQAPLQLSQLEQQTERLLAHQSQALALQAPRLKPQDVSAVLQQAASDSLGNGAKLSIEASRATLNLNNVSADALAYSWQRPETKRLHCRPKRTCKKPKQVHKTFGAAH